MSTLAFSLSLLASALSVGATVPQIFKLLQKASTKDLSLACFSMHAVAGVLWSFYGALTEAYVLAVEAGLVSVLNIIVVVHILEQGAGYGYTNTPISRQASLRQRG
jgi:uncharacterized protein with PQ loop repeat